MKQLFFTIAAFLAVGLFSIPSLMADTTEANKLERLLSEKFPDVRIESVRMSADLPGFYEVVTPDEIVYADANGAHLIRGSVMDIATRENLTAKRWYEINKIDFGSLPLEKAIKIVKGNGSRRLAVFEDPFCPYCVEFEKRMERVDNITIYVFLYPLEEVHPGATDAARQIWCAEDRAAAWTGWMVTEKAPIAKKNCTDIPVDDLVQLGKQLRIYSTPTLFFTDGLRVPGVVDVERIEKKLDALQSDKHR